MSMSRLPGEIKSWGAKLFPSLAGYESDVTTLCSITSGTFDDLINNMINNLIQLDIHTPGGMGIGEF